METIYEGGMPGEVKARLDDFLSRRKAPPDGLLLLRPPASFRRLNRVAAIVFACVCAAVVALLVVGWSRLPSQRRMVFCVSLPVYAVGGWYCWRAASRGLFEISPAGIRKLNGGSRLDWIELHTVAWNRKRECLYFYTEPGDEVAVEDVEGFADLVRVFLPAP